MTCNSCVIDGVRLSNTLECVAGLKSQLNSGTCQEGHIASCIVRSSGKSLWLIQSHVRTPENSAFLINTKRNTGAANGKKSEIMRAPTDIESPVLRPARSAHQDHEWFMAGGRRRAAASLGFSRKLSSCVGQRFSARTQLLQRAGKICTKDLWVFWKADLVHHPRRMSVDREMTNVWVRGRTTSFGANDSVSQARVRHFFGPPLKDKS